MWGQNITSPTGATGDRRLLANLRTARGSSGDWQERLPVELLRDTESLTERRLGLFFGHLQEQQVGQLLDVVAVTDVVTQDVTVVP